jgi:hypothetical protein
MPNQIISFISSIAKRRFADLWQIAPAFEWKIGLNPEPLNSKPESVPFE